MMANSNAAAGRSTKKKFLWFWTSLSGVIGIVIGIVFLIYGCVGASAMNNDEYRDDHHSSDHMLKYSLFIWFGAAILICSVSAVGIAHRLRRSTLTAQSSASQRASRPINSYSPTNPSQSTRRSQGHSQSPGRSHGNSQPVVRSHGNNQSACCSHGNSQSAIRSHGNNQSAFISLLNTILPPIRPQRRRIAPSCNHNNGVRTQQQQQQQQQRRPQRPNSLSPFGYRNMIIGTNRAQNRSSNIWSTAATVGSLPSYEEAHGLPRASVHQSVSPQIRSTPHSPSSGIPPIPPPEYTPTASEGHLSLTNLAVIGKSSGV